MVVDLVLSESRLCALISVVLKSLFNFLLYAKYSIPQNDTYDRRQMRNKRSLFVFSFTLISKVTG